MGKILMIIYLLLVPTFAFAQGKPNGDPNRLQNGIPDFHQYEAEVIRIVDADTITLKIHLLPGLEYTVNVRSRGVDAPELRGKCDWEKIIAAEAKKAIEKRFPIDSWVYVENIEEGSFSGRVIADIKQWYGNQRWRTVTKILLDKGGRWGVPYIEGEKFDWCQTLPPE